MSASRWSATGAVVLAVLGSACCWLPLAAVALGLSAGGAAGLIGAYRIPLLVAAVVLLGVSFYFVYVRRPACADGACKPQRRPAIILWVSIALVLLVGVFPSLTTPELPAASAAPSDTTAPGAVERTYAIAGMSCAGCSAEIHKVIAAVPGVHSVNVSYDDKAARVTFAGPADDAAVIAAVDDLGFTATPLATP